MKHVSLIFRARSGFVFGAALAISLALAGPVGAQEPEKTALKKEGWAAGVNAGFNLTRGNSETMMLNGGILSEYNRGANELRLEVQGSYGESTLTADDGTEEDITTVQNAKAVADYKRLVDERNYGYLNASLLHDDMAGIDYRLVAGGGLGHYFIKSGIQALDAEAGIAYMRQKMGDTHNTANLRLAQRYEVVLMGSAKLWEAAEYMAAFNDFENYFITCEIGAEAPMAAGLNLRVVLQDQYNNIPGPGKERNNLQLVAGIGFNL